MTTCSTSECGTGLGSIIRPDDPSNNSILTATPAFGGVDVSWTLPATNPHAVAFVRIWRGILADFNSAILLTHAGGTSYYDKTPSVQALEYFYWIQFVSINGTVGELIGPASAVARPPIGDVIAGLSEQIEYGALSTALKANIDKIELNRIAQEGSMVSITDEQLLIRESLALIQDDLQTNFVLITEETTARQNAEEAFASQINTVATAAQDNLAAVQVTLQTNIDMLDGAVIDIGARYTAQVNVNGLVGGFGVYNNGNQVEAGFDVDRFWIGRTGANKRKPFIVENDTVYIDKAAIANASITLAKIDTATIQNLSAINANMGTLTAGKILFNTPGDPNSYLQMDAATQTLSVINAGVVRVKIGKLS